MLSNIFKKYLNTEQQSKVIDVSNELGINPNWLLGVIYFETGKTFSPSVTNSIGSVGLIQFTKDKASADYKTINGKRYRLNDIKRMSFVQQMDLVKLYYQEQISYLGQKPKNFLDTYLITFFPNAVGKSSDYVLQTKSLTKSLIARQNPIFDKNKNKEITRGEIEEHFKTWFSKTSVKYTDVAKGLLLKTALGVALFFLLIYLLINNKNN